MKDVADDLAFIVRNSIAYIKELEAELARCKQVCAATAEAWREEAALAEPVQEPPCATRECMPSQCPNCASLQDQNTELDRKLAELEAALRAQP